MSRKNMKERRSIPTPLCKRAGSGHRKEVIVARIDQDRLFSQRSESLALKEARSRDIVGVSQNFVHGLNEHFGHHVIPLALRTSLLSKRTPGCMRVSSAL